MASRRRFVPWLLPWLLGACLAACPSRARRLDEERWNAAEAAWRRAEPSAFETWRRLDPQQPHGRAAWTRLQEADRRYRRAVELLSKGQPGVRDTLSDALALAPMDPALYLPFARACRERGSLWRAVDFYRKYLARTPPLPDAAIARAELSALDDRDFPPEIEQRIEGPRAKIDEGWLWRLSGLGIAGAGLLALGLTALLLRHRRDRTLREVVVERPEVHQTVAYLIGCLRHEFLKHRIGAAGEALSAVSAGRASDEQRRFLEERLCKGEPLLVAWRAHVAAIDRALGLGRSLALSDPLFREAERALGLLGRPLAKASDGNRASTAQTRLQRFDRELGALAARLSSCLLDDAFLREALASTRAEWSSGKVDLDDVAIGAVPGGVAVDVYRTDLRIVLKNIFRNAIAALAESAHPRRLAVDVSIDVEPTGEEIVRIRVRDSGGGQVTVGDAVDVEHGLGIVRAALRRYDGSIEVLPGGDGYAKAVVIRLFASEGTVGEAA